MIGISMMYVIFIDYSTSTCDNSLSLTFPSTEDQFKNAVVFIELILFNRLLINQLFYTSNFQLRASNFLVLHDLSVFNFNRANLPVQIYYYGDRQSSFRGRHGNNKN